MLHDLKVVAVRMVGPFEGAAVVARMHALMGDEPETAFYRSIFDFRDAEGWVTDANSAAVRDFRFATRERLGRADAPDGPHALLSKNPESLGVMIALHHERHPDAHLIATASVAEAWRTVAGEAPMPRAVKAFFRRT